MKEERNNRVIMSPAYDLNKIKFATDEAMFQRAVELYESGKVTEVEEAFGDFTAVVAGTQPYRVSVSVRNYRHGHGTCYVGEKGTLCKHMVALALYAVLNGKPLSAEEKEQRNEIKRSDRREALSDEELAAVKASITGAMKYIKSYRVPRALGSRIRAHCRKDAADCGRLFLICLFIDKRPVFWLICLIVWRKS